MIEWLAARGVELIEQPMPAGQLDNIAWLKKRSPLPLIADEDVCGIDDIDQLAGVYDGINVKLMKAGGATPASMMLEKARNLGLRTMLGCMIESSIGITAASYLAAQVDWIDLDGNLLISNDPFIGTECRDGKLVLPTKQLGLGVEERPDALP
jgi:L-alanine-DL-glutamate epimerase-like enolase superfamily enzyme